MQRPTGVTVLAVVAAIGGVLLVLASLALLGFGAIVAVYGGGLAFLFGLLTLALGVAELAMAYGFWTMKAWAWTWGIALQAISVVLALINLVFGYGTFVGLIENLIVAGIVIYYLNQPGIRKVFAAPEKGWPFIGNM